MQYHEPIWSPSGDFIESSVPGDYLRWLRSNRGLTFDGYQSLWRWSIKEDEGFWGTVAQYFGIFDPPRGPRWVGESMEDRSWFPSIELNYADVALRAAVTEGDCSAITAYSQTRGPWEISWAELRGLVAAVRAGLEELGVGRGDCVAAYLPNIPEAVIVFLATASLGAVFSSCSPEFGLRAALDRFSQVAPKVLFAVDGYRWGRSRVERQGHIHDLAEGLSSVEQTIVVPYLAASPTIGARTHRWDEFLSRSMGTDFAALPVNFNEPLYVLFSSGTTGLPKPIVHRHGGIILEHLKWLGFHANVRPGDRFMWYSTTSWMAWNFSVSALLRGASLVILDGDPNYPDPSALWRLVGDSGVSHFGTAAPYISACQKASLVPRNIADLSALRGMTSSGAPLAPAGYEWVYQAVGPDLYFSSASGGTDVCSAFVGMSPLLPVWPGEMSCRFLGADVQAFSPDGEVLIGEEGELVLRSPMPSMPLGFWGDADGSRFHRAYFARYPGVWAHGDWIRFTEYGTCAIAGRSDATLNRGGVRLGTADFYAVLDAIDEISDSLVVHLEDSQGGMGELVIFVALTDDEFLDEQLQGRISAALRDELSPRHVPNQIVQVNAVPRTSTGKRMEVPIKRLLTGRSTESDFESLPDRSVLGAFEQWALDSKRVVAQNA